MFCFDIGLLISFILGSINPIVRPFTPDGSKDFGNIWERQQHPPATQKLAKPNALMFFHIPLYVLPQRPPTFLRSPLLILTVKSPMKVQTRTRAQDYLSTSARPIWKDKARRRKMVASSRMACYTLSKLNTVVRVVYLR